MSKVTESKIEELAREKLEGKSYTAIRQELAASGMEEGEITNLLRQVDERVLKQTLMKGSPDRAQQWYRAGLVLAVLGLILSIAYNAGIILQGLAAWILYIPFFAGILVMFYGKFSKNKESTTSETGTGEIRRRRPYK